MYVIGRHQLDQLIQLLSSQRTVIGPTVVDGAVRLRPIHGVADLPTGWVDEQSPGSYRVEHQPGVAASFGWAVGPDSLKHVFHPPQRQVFSAERDGDGHIRFTAAGTSSDPLAMVGVRPCELAAAAVQDRVLAQGPFVDADYVASREDVVVVVVDCGQPAATCFCTSMGTGPRSEYGYDIALTEIDGGARYVARPGSESGENLLESVGAAPAADADVAAANAVIAGAVEKMDVRLDPERVRVDLSHGARAAEWADVARRCLACGNCTAVCPTCFCTGVVDTTEDGAWDRTRVWASCFELGFSEVHGRPVRSSIAARYRQWATHKLSTWFDQFGTSGCVGCGRCITWCPVGIDLIEEARRVRPGRAANSQEVSA